MGPFTHTSFEIPIACDPGAIPVEARAAHLTHATQLLADAVSKRQELQDGYAFHFCADQYAEVVAFIAHERLCCPFFHFSLDVPPVQGPLVLQITGGEGVKAFLQAAFTSVEP